MNETLRRRATLYGIATGYHDVAGTWHEPPDATLRAVMEAMRIDPDGPAVAPGTQAWPPAVVVRQGTPNAWAPPAGEALRVTLESGELVNVPAGRWAGAALPLGYHTVTGCTGATRLIVTPPRAHLPAGVRAGGRAYGVALQLYALRTRANWGIGDLGDLGDLATRWRAGVGFILVNPLHAAPPIEPSPYFPSSRLMRNPLYLGVDALPETRLLGPEGRRRLDELRRRAQREAAGELIDRVSAFRVKDAALRLCYEQFRHLSASAQAPLRNWRDQTYGVDAYATFYSLQAELVSAWQRWPAAWRQAGPDVVARRRDDPDVAFNAWSQWRLDQQLASVSPLDLGLINDLAVGFSPEGFDAWWFQDVLAQGVSVGAPPDPLGPHGQNWSVPAFDPVRLGAAAYEPFVQTVRANMRHVAGLRIDHVMSLFRLFWIPDGMAPSAGTYVRYPAEDLLGILALESQRAGVLVIGEDLGTVEDGVREALSAAEVLSTRVLWFERDDAGAFRPPEAYPRLALATETTHDLPTIAGLWTGADVDRQAELGVIGAGELPAAREDAASVRRELLAALAAAEVLEGDAVGSVGVPEHGGRDDRVGDLGGADALVEVVTDAVGAFLAKTPSMLVATALEDVLAVAERPNVPGTASAGNWCRRLPAIADDAPVPHGASS